MDRSSRQNINKETEAFNDTLDQIVLIDTCRTFHLKIIENTFSLRAHETFSRIDRWLVKPQNQSINLREVISNQAFFFSNHKGMKLGIVHRKNWKKETYGD